MKEYFHYYASLVEEMNNEKIIPLAAGADVVINKMKVFSSYKNAINTIELMLEKHTEAYPNDDEPYLFPDLPGNYFAFNFSVLENTELDGTGAPEGVYGWSGYHNTHFWIDPQNNTYGLFMSRSIEFDFSIKKNFKKAVYLQ